MKYPWIVALRYLFAKKTHNAVNYISWITTLGFVVGSFALIVILSTLNGFEGLILSMYSKYDPDFRVEAALGRTLDDTPELQQVLQNTPGLLYLSPIIENQAVIKHYDHQTAVYVKGVPANYFEKTGIEDFVLEGQPFLSEGEVPQIIIGAGIDFKLQTRVTGPQSIATIYVPRKGNYAISDPNLVKSQVVKPSGVLFLDDQINQKYVFVPLDFARDLFEYNTERTSYELRVEPRYLARAERYLSEALEPLGMISKNRLEQQASLYKMFKSEKWVTYALLTFVLLLASFNVTGSITMLVVEKQKDIHTFKVLGAQPAFIRKIFFFQGLLMSAFGSLLGLTLGVILVVLQQHYSLILMRGAIVESYPVALHFSDILLIFVTTLCLGILTSAYPSYQSVRESQPAARQSH